MKEIGTVLESSPSCIIVNIEDAKVFDEHKDVLKIGQYLQIQEGNLRFVIAQIQNIKCIFGGENFTFNIISRPIGMIDDDEKFSRGSIILPVPTEPAYVMDKKLIEVIYSADSDMDYSMGTLLQNPDLEFKMSGNRLFSKHIAIVGSTGSGKSCAVARILQNALGIDEGKNIHKELQKNTHIIIFDIHSEYASAFSLSEDQSFNTNILSVDSMALPYWLMNADELEALFIESNEQNSHNQISQFKQAVILNKEKHNPEMRITYDTPVYFSIKEVFNYISNMNNEVLGKKEDDLGQPKLADNTYITRDSYFDKIYGFSQTSTAKDSKASNGPFNGEFDRFLLRLETKLNDKRLNFILDPTKDDSGNPYHTDDFSHILKQFLGYIKQANVTVIDLSGIPFEVLSITVSLVARLVFDFCFNYSKLRHIDSETNDIPVMIVCEEAHNYIPQSGGSEYKASKKSIERIAKEGRKYGISTMIVSQRPAEVSETIIAQCNNFIALRLNNDNDQNFVKRLLPENDSSVADSLPNLGLGEALIVGDACLLPSLVKLKKPNPEPKSESVKVYDMWQKPWINPAFEEVINRWRKNEE